MSSASLITLKPFMEARQSKMRSLIIITVIIWSASCLLVLNDAVHVRFTNAKCSSDNKMVVVERCRLKAVQRNKTLLQFTAKLLETMYDIRARVRFVKKANGYKPFLYDITFDICEFQRKHNNPFINIVYRNFKDYSNLNHTCPYKGTVYVNDAFINPENVRLPLPTGEYGLIITWIFNKIGRVSSDFYFEYFEDH